MRKAPILLLLFFMFLLSLSPVLGTTVCDGQLCLTYIGTQTAETDVRYMDYWGGYVYASREDHFYKLNSSWGIENSVDTVTLYSHGLTFGGGWNNKDGYFLGSYDPTGTNYFGKWNFTDEIFFGAKGRQYGAGGDYYDGYFWQHDDDGRLYKLNTDLDELSSCEVVQHEGGVHHLNGTDKLLIIQDGSPDLIKLYDENCNEYGTIEFSDFGLSLDNWGGITAPDNNSLLWVADGSETILEFSINASSVESVLTPLRPLDGDSFVDDIIVMKLNLNAGLNGTLSCYVNDTFLVHNQTYENGTHTIDFSSGHLPDGENSWYCNFTDTKSNSWYFTTQVFTISTGIMNTAGDAIANLFGFDSDDYSTSTEKGRAFLAILISIFGALGVGGHFKSGEIAGICLLGLFILFTFTGDLPAWLGVILIIISGFIVVEYVKKFHK